MEFNDAEFGRLVFGGKEFREDIVVFNCEAYPRGPRENNHFITLEEFKRYFKKGTRKVIIGNGFMGVLRLSGEVKEFLKERGVALVEASSPEAIKLYNSEKDKKGVLAIIHSTC